MFQHDYSVYWQSQFARPLKRGPYFDASPSWPDRPESASVFLKSWAVTNLKMAIVCPLAAILAVVVLLIFLPLFLPTSTSSWGIWVIAASACLAAGTIGALTAQIQEGGMRAITGPLPLWSFASGLAISATATSTVLAALNNAGAPHPGPSFVHSLVGSIALGMAQWIVLRSKFDHAWTWPVIFIGSSILGVTLSHADVPIIAAVLACIVFWAGYVCATGLALWEMTRTPRAGLPSTDGTIRVQLIGLALLAFVGLIVIR